MSVETLEFRTELKELLHLIIHSLYSHKDIFLRELISNASDAIDTVRFRSLTQEALAEEDSEWGIRLIPDEEAGTLTIADNGIGMSRESIVENLGTIAHSGTRAFLESLRQAQSQNRPDLIGQFGVGFYSAFMVADKVVVHSRMAGQPGTGVQWSSEGQGTFALEDRPRDKRGTDVVLHLKAEDREFLKPWKLRQLVKKYSDFVEHPITLVSQENGETKEEVLNARKALWLRPRNEVTQEEYEEFYKHLSHDFRKPLKTIHYAAEGAVEFKALLYLPAHQPFDLMMGDKHKGLQLYIQRVFILDDAEVLLPRWLRFVRGVVDSPDLPLNVSRELLQQSAPLDKIRSNLTSKVLSTLEELKKREPENYRTFFMEMGIFLKEGIWQEYQERERLADLLLVQSTTTPKGEFTTLADYVERMPSDQEEILYLAGESRDLLEQSPHLEGFRARGQEVLLLDDPADEFAVDALREYKGKKLRGVDRAGKETVAVPEDQQRRFEPLLACFREKVGDIREARLTTRLKDSPVCLVAQEDAPGAHLERLLQRMNRDAPPQASKRILEVNPDHAVVQALEKIVAANPADPRLEKYCRLLYDQAVLTEGSRIQDPLAFTQRVNELLLRDLLIG